MSPSVGTIMPVPPTDQASKTNPNQLKLCRSCHWLLYKTIQLQCRLLSSQLLLTHFALHMSIQFRSRNAHFRPLQYMHCVAPS
ncbi:hypothetical protein XELAEV_18004862mg [Xenopus laevis]|uniref:Uncharacterized protein n=1 Tax=Xenopus laevis TaxID=8355 RepID=A0A974DX01_XENLA|nr:hypothetical protein XELAEV_18004862mg [Xenopus laevis]